MFPEGILERGFNFFYSFKKKEYLGENDWEQLVEDWRKEREQLRVEGMKRQTAIDKLVFFFVDGGSFLKIYDKRDTENYRIFVLNELERAIFLSCVDVTSFQDLRETFSHIPEYQLVAILHTFEKNDIVFREDNHYLNLPLHPGQVISKFPKRELQQLLHNFGNHRSL